jgi:hypothetical protein
MQTIQGLQPTRTRLDRPVCIDCQTGQQFSVNDTGNFVLLVNEEMRFLCDACAKAYSSREEAFKHLIVSSRTPGQSFAGSLS